MALKTDLKAVYKLDESSGSTATDSHNTNDGTYNGNLPTAVSGKDGDGQDFDDTNPDYVTLPKANFNNTGEITYSLWVNGEVDSNGTNGEVDYMGSYGSSTDGFIIRTTNNGGDFQFFSGVNNLITAGNPQANTWHHIVVTRDSNNNVEMFVDGSSIGTSSSSNGWHDEDISLGRRGSSLGSSDDRHYDGIIDEVYIWNRALSSSEVSDLYNSGTGKFYPFDTIVSVSAAQSITTDTPATEDVVIQMSSDYPITATDKGAEITTKHPMNTLSVGKGGPGSRFIEHEWPNKEGISAGITKQTADPVLREE